MKITKNYQDTTFTLTLEGCLDTASTAEFDAAIAAMPATTTKLLFDFSALEFISSSALRSLVAVKKNHSDLEIVISHMNEVVQEVFEVSGLNEIFTIQK